MILGIILIVVGIFEFVLGASTYSPSKEIYFSAAIGFIISGAYIISVSYRLKKLREDVDNLKEKLPDEPKGYISGYGELPPSKNDKKD